MFNVGANNPNVGNDRRRQLLDQLAQQLATRFAQQNAQGHAAGPDFSASDGARPFIDILKKRQQQNGALAAQSAPTRAAGQGRATAGTPLIAMPVHGMGGHGQGIMRPAPATMPGRLTGQAAPIPGMPVPGSAPPPVRPAVGQVVQNPNVPGGSYINDNAGPTNPLTPFSTPAMNPVAPQAAIAASQGSALPPDVHGWISIGNGVFYNPVTGTVRGGSAGISNGLTGIDGKF